LAIHRGESLLLMLMLLLLPIAVCKRGDLFNKPNETLTDDNSRFWCNSRNFGKSR